MAKKKKTRKRVNKTHIDNTPKHVLPSGFWAQVGALGLIALSILFVVAWFNTGGPFPEMMHDIAIQSVGYTLYILPILFSYVAVEVFRAENNKLPFVMKLATLTSIFWFAGLFGLLKNAEGKTTGGFVGDFVNSGMLMLVNSTVAVFIYLLLILVTTLFIVRVSPFAVIKKMWELSRRDSAELDENVKVMRNAAAIDAPKSSIGHFKMNAGVPTMDPSELDKPEKSTSKLSQFKNSVSRDKTTDDQSALVTVRDPNWVAPSIDLLENKQSPADAGDVQQNARIIQETLHEFDIDVEMDGANIGPRVTQFTLQPPSGVKLSRITQLENNLALKLAASHLRIEAPIPGQRAVGIEVPNRKAADVRLHSILSSPQWKQKTEPLTFAIGKDISGKVVIGELNQMPHLLIAGQTKAGKSVMINTLLTSLLYYNSPSEMKLILVDPKRVEMTAYEDIPHLLTPVITEVDKTISALKWSVQEMERRYMLMQEHKVRSIADYNRSMQTKGKKISIADEAGLPQEHEDGAMPYIVIVIDELNDLMVAAPKDLEGMIIRLAQKGRAAGVHLVLATQSPRKDVITGLIKANIPAKIAFAVSNQLESRIILDDKGAEKLLGNGDMLLSTASMSQMRRVQGAWVTDNEVHKVMDHLRMQSPAQYNDDVVSQPVHLNGKGGVVMDFDSSNEDDLYQEAIQVVMNSGKASASLLQRRLRVGYARAARIIEDMEKQGIVGPPDGARPRDVLISSMDELGGGLDEI